MLVAESLGHPGVLLIFAGGVAAPIALTRAVGRIADLYPSTRNLVLSLVEFSW